MGVTPAQPARSRTAAARDRRRDLVALMFMELLRGMLVLRVILPLTISISRCRGRGADVLCDPHHVRDRYSGFTSGQRYRGSGVQEDMTPVEAALHLCETSSDSVAHAKLAVAEVRETIERVRQTRRRTDEILAKVRAKSQGGELAGQP